MDPKREVWPNVYYMPSSIHKIIQQASVKTKSCRLLTFQVLFHYYIFIHQVGKSHLHAMGKAVFHFLSTTKSFIHLTVAKYGSPPL